MSESNGQAPAEPARVPFGDLPTQDLHPDTAAAMLRQLFETEPGTFARLHLAAVGGGKFTVTVRRREAGS